MSDWQIYRRLLGYALPHWFMFCLSLLGYLIYSLGNVLLADLMQFLLDSLDDTVKVTSGIVSTIAYHFYDAGAQTRWSLRASPYRWRWSSSPLPGPVVFSWVITA